MMEHRPGGSLMTGRCSLEPKLGGMRVAELRPGTVLLRATLTLHKGLGAIDISLLCGST